MQRLSDNYDQLYAQIEGKLAFQYSDPERGFDRSRVKGVMAKLIRVLHKETATALEIAAGGRLYQVVVDTEQTGKLHLTFT